MSARRFREPASPATVALTVIIGLAVASGSISLATTEGATAVSTQLRLWWMAAAAVLATATPHLLFPDRSFARELLFARPPGRVLVREFRRATPLLVVLLLPCVIVPLAAGLDATAAVGLMASSLAGVAALWWIAVQTYLRLGAISQLWQEGRRGAWFEASTLRARMPVGMPRGMYPVLGATSGIFLIGAAAAIVWGALQLAGVPVAGGVTGLVLVVGAALRQASWFRAADAFIFRSHAFFNETYRAFGGARMADREPLPFAALYWVPRALRPAVWAHLRQMDRRMPIGRLVAAGLVLFWIIVYGQGHGTMSAVLLALVVIAKNAAPFMTAGPDASPPGLHLRLHSWQAWVLVRGFMSLRWTFPIALALAIAAVFASTLPWAVVVAWVVADVALAFASGVVLALNNEHAYRRRFA